MKNEYLYETHLHTCEGSACGKVKGEEYPAYYKKLGYSGIIVTDHFFNGNCAVARDLAWEERIERYCLGYEHTKAAGDKIGFDVFFGVEFNFTGDEYLLYGIDKQWLIEHPQIMEWSHRQLYEELDAIGACVVQAHPYRQRDYIKIMTVAPTFVHGVEVANGGNYEEDDAEAYKYALKWGLPMTSGSDIHYFTEGKKPFGVKSHTKWNSIFDYVEEIKSNSGYSIITTEERKTAKPGYKINVPFRQIND